MNPLSSDEQQALFEQNRASALQSSEKFRALGLELSKFNEVCDYFKSSDYSQLCKNAHELTNSALTSAVLNGDNLSLETLLNYKSSKVNLEVSKAIGIWLKDHYDGVIYLRGVSTKNNQQAVSLRLLEEVSVEKLFDYLQEIITLVKPDSNNICEIRVIAPGAYMGTFSWKPGDTNSFSFSCLDIYFENKSLKECFDFMITYSSSIEGNEV
jgi:hypothetical protein